LIHDESHFPFVPLLDPHVIVTPSDVKFREEGARAYFIDQLRDKWKGVAISDRPLVNSSVVLDRTELSIFLLDEEERGGIRALGWANVTFLHVFLYKLLQFLLLELGKGVDLSGYGAWGIGFQFDGMVPDSWFREALGRLFAENLVVALVSVWYWVFGGVLLRGTRPFDPRYQDRVSLCSSGGGSSREEFGSCCVETSYDDGELGMVEPPFEPIDLGLHSGKPRISQDQFVVS
jgi:hypothetical protein